MNVADANETLDIVVYDIPAILQLDKQGQYDQIISAVQRQQNEQWNYTVAPPGRVDKLFDLNKADCIFPFDKRFHKNSNTVNSLPVHVAQAYIYSLPHLPPIKSLTELKGKRIGARTGMLYGPEFDKLNLDIKYVTQIEQNIDKLLSGRIDAFVAWAPDSIAAFKRKNITPTSDTRPFITHNDAFLCHDTPKSRAFINSFNKALRKITAKN